MLRLLHAADFHLDSPFSGLTGTRSLYLAATAWKEICRMAERI